MGLMRRSRLLRLLLGTRFLVHKLILTTASGLPEAVVFCAGVEENLRGQTTCRYMNINAKIAGRVMRNW
jgi:hypothetical protein